MGVHFHRKLNDLLIAISVIFLLVEMEKIAGLYSLLGASCALSVMRKWYNTEANYRRDFILYRLTFSHYFFHLTIYFRLPIVVPDIFSRLLFPTSYHCPSKNVCRFPILWCTRLKEVHVGCSEFTTRYKNEN